ncbi:hypothetical protein P1P91_11265 [Halomonas piscis]|uniref:Uncharacterized protein n=1 Tax=Halomonas piscis TaxID=3031727 RepID=A0ABY9YX14_9GAMM|nr:hypothetical protein [Halomonas piscis]WNK19425.1 hypothetical protein P1P91_11265 [Halomonas piscis]
MIVFKQNKDIKSFLGQYQAVVHSASSRNRQSGQVKRKKAQKRLFLMPGRAFSAHAPASREKRARLCPKADRGQRNRAWPDSKVADTGMEKGLG